MLLNAEHTVSSVPSNVIWYYSCWQPLYKQLLFNFPFIKFIEGMPDTLNDDQLFPPEKINWVVVDDLMGEACGSAEIERAFTKYVHHKNLSIFYIVQNLFCQGKSSRTITLNAKYLVLFKNPRDKLQIATLARQMYPGKSAFFMEAYEDATREPYGYLLVDLNATTPEQYRLRTGLFPPERPAAYIFKNTRRLQKTAVTS